MITHVYKLASKEFEGQGTGQTGFHKASEYLNDSYSNNAIPSPLGGINCYQHLPKSYFTQNSPASQNVVVFIEGSEYPKEIIILSEHLDHLGATEETTFYGADDNASGTAALKEIAQAFITTKNEGHGTKGSILSLHSTADETGLLSSKYYVKHLAN